MKNFETSGLKVSNLILFVRDIVFPANPRQRLRTNPINKTKTGYHNKNNTDRILIARRNVIN